MVKEKKAQGALEFLMTYGWAFLVILVMIGALAYFGVLNPTRFLPDRCMFSTPPFNCKGQEFTIKDAVTDTFQIQLQNTFGRGVKVSNINITFTDFPSIDCNSAAGSLTLMGTASAANGVFAVPVEVPEGSLALLKGSCALGTDLEVGRKTKVLVQVTWKESSSSSGITKISEGELYAQVQ